MNKNLLFAFACFCFLSAQNSSAQQADAWLVNFASPVDPNFCPGMLPISINVYNNDLIDITEVVLDWSVNGVSQSPVTWSGTLAAGFMIPVELTSAYDFQSGNFYDIDVTIQTVNTLPDPNTSNDHNLVSFYAYPVYDPSFYWDGCVLECLNAVDYISIIWYRNGSVDPDAPDSNIYFPAQPGSYSMVGISQDSCSIAADTSIFVTPIMFDITATNAPAFCEGDSTGLVFTISEPGTYTWTTGNSSDDTIYASTTGWYAVYGQSQTFCDIADSFYVTVYAPPVVSISDNNDTLVSTYSGLHEWYFNGNPIGGAHDSTYVPTQSGNYYCIVTDIHGCTGMSNTINWIFPGISVPVVRNEVMLYPNPATTMVTVRFDSPQDAMMLTMYDATGRIALRKTVGENTLLDISSLDAGVYQCVFKGEGRFLSQKLIKTN